MATDISGPSLEVCERNLSQLGVKNVKLVEQSINDADYVEQFDYIICTGVIHHNADPSLPLAKLGAALKPDGILELMVYNYYHRILTTAYQKAMRYLFKDDPAVGLDQQLDVTKDLMNRFPVENTMSFYLQTEKEQPREYLADSFLQPVEHSYTVESLTTLLDTARLQLCLPCIYVFDKSAGRVSWNLEFQNETAARHYEALPDHDRWQITNVLTVEKSPTLCFYVQRNDSAWVRKSEKEVCDDFLDTVFERYSTTMSNYVGGNGNYQFSATPIPHPSPRVPVDQTARRVFKETDRGKTIRETLAALEIESVFNAVNSIRTQLTTPLFPYLKAVVS